MKISNGKRDWFKRKMGGKDALSYLLRFRSMGFVEAVELLSDGIGSPPLRIVQPTEARKPFRLPEAARFPAHVLSYLQKRCIGGNIIRACIEAGALFESKLYHNCVFVGNGPDGRVRYVTLRGTYGDFRQEFEGSDKRYGFVLPARCADCHRLAVAESLIDPLSVAQPRKFQSEGWRDCACVYLSSGLRRGCCSNFFHEPQETDEHFKWVGFVRQFRHKDSIAKVFYVLFRILTGNGVQKNSRIATFLDTIVVFPFKYMYDYGN